MLMLLLRLLMLLMLLVLLRLRVLLLLRNHALSRKLLLWGGNALRIRVGMMLDSKHKSAFDQCCRHGSELKGDGRVMSGKMRVVKWTSPHPCQQTKSLGGGRGGSSAAGGKGRGAVQCVKGRRPQGLTKRNARF